MLLVGVGRRGDAGPDACRRAIGRVAAQLVKRKRIATTLPQIAGRGFEDAVQATVEGLLLGSYRFDRYKIRRASAPALEEVVVLGGRQGRRQGRRGRRIERGQVVAESQAWARDLVNTPALDLSPDAAGEGGRQAMAKQVGLASKVWSEAELKRGGFGGIIGVGQGSVNPPRLIELRYEGGGKQAPDRAHRQGHRVRLGRPVDQGRDRHGDA